MVRRRVDHGGGGGRPRGRVLAASDGLDETVLGRVLLELLQAPPLASLLEHVAARMPCQRVGLSIGELVVPNDRLAPHRLRRHAAVRASGRLATGALGGGTGGAHVVARFRRPQPNRFASAHRPPLVDAVVTAERRRDRAEGVRGGLAARRGEGGVAALLAGERGEVDEDGQHPPGPPDLLVVQRVRRAEATLGRGRVRRHLHRSLVAVGAPAGDVAYPILDRRQQRRGRVRSDCGAGGAGCRRPRQPVRPALGAALFVPPLSRHAHQLRALVCGEEAVDLDDDGRGADHTPAMPKPRPRVVGRQWPRRKLPGIACWRAPGQGVWRRQRRRRRRQRCRRLPSSETVLQHLIKLRMTSAVRPARTRNVIRGVVAGECRSGVASPGVGGVHSGGIVTCDRCHAQPRVALGTAIKVQRGLAAACGHVRCWHRQPSRLLQCASTRSQIPKVVIFCSEGCFCFEGAPKITLSNRAGSSGSYSRQVQLRYY